MKVLMINGSPHKNGNTSIALGEMEKIFAQEGIETEIYMWEIRTFGAVLPVIAAWKKENVLLTTLSTKLLLNLKKAMVWWWQVRFIMLPQTPL